VLAESFERIHRSNLVGMGVLPLQFLDGQNADSLGLTGTEVFEVRGLAAAVDQRGGPATVTVSADGRTFRARVRLDTAREADHYRHGGIMPFVVRTLLGAD
jgi:aconitate hydratase